ncbi:MAG: pilin [Candidatus Gracilibacteria bacterium]|nr:pilin [Candidatus Gracilibacteria bacterium]
MKKILLIITFLFTGFCNFVFFPAFTHAAYCSVDSSNAVEFLQSCGSDTIGVDPSQGDDVEGIRDRVTVIVERAIALGAVFAIAFLVWAGIQYTTAYGDDEKLKHAKSTAIYAIAGLILILAAFGLIDIFIGFINQFLSL